MSSEDQPRSFDTTESLTIYDKRRDCVERFHLGDPAAGVDMAAEIDRLRVRERTIVVALGVCDGGHYLNDILAKIALLKKEAGRE